MAAPVRLRGARADAYLQILRGLLRVARPGAQFPDARRLDATLSFLGPAGSRGLEDGLDLDPASGLPTLRELLRVRADRDLAPAFLVEHGDRLPEKAAYYRSLLGAEVAAASALEVRLRSRGRGAARFEVVHDRLDLASGCLVRCAWRLEERGADHVGLARGDLSAPTARFRAAVERCAGADAELAFLLMSEQEGVSVEEVVRGQLGPLHFSGIEAPALVREVVEAVPGAFVLHSTLERAAPDVAADRLRDPFGALYREALGADARAAVEARRAALGYRVAKERRLACTPEVEAALRAALSRAGAPLLVRSA